MLNKTLPTLYYPLLFLTLVLFFQCISPVFAEVTPIDKVAAVVDNDIIMQSELNQKMTEVLFRLKQNKTTPPPESILREQVLNKMIIDSIQLQKAEQGGIKIPQGELDQAVASIAAQNKMSPQEFIEYASKSGLSPDSIIDSIRRDIVLQQLQRIVINKKIDITEREIDDFLLSDEGKQRSSDVYHLAHIILPISSSTTTEEINQIQLRAESISQQANAGTDFKSLAVTYSKAPDALEGGDIGWRKKSQMPSIYGDRIEVLKVGETSAPFRSNAGIHIISLLDKQGYSDQVIQLTETSHILIKPTAIRNETETVALLNQIRLRAQNGEKFSDLAKKYTEDIGTALNGGSLGWVSPGQMVSKFESVMNNTPIGEISAPFQTQFGWHILLVEARKQKDVSTNMLRNQAKNFLYSQKFEEQLARWQNEIRNDAYIDIK